uniref:Uncharacterized protein n=1 Tax=Arundo donax TaxID=35708 RepID=A0A0A9DYJ4_ARUDO
MEESQAAKQAEKDAKKKACAKELKKLKKAREKEEKEKEKEKAKAQALQSQTDLRGPSAAQMANKTASVPGLKPKHQSPQLILMAKEEERQRKLAEEREKRAAAAERRHATLAAQSAGTSSAATADIPAQRQRQTMIPVRAVFLPWLAKYHSTDTSHNYKYCSTTCMHLHSEMLGEDREYCMMGFIRLSGVTFTS